MQPLSTSFYRKTAMDVAGILRLFNKTFFSPYNELFGRLLKPG